MSERRSRRRRWDEEAATSGATDEVRHWLLWGTGEPPEGAIREAAGASHGAKPEGEALVEPGNDIARTMAARLDPVWAELHGWVLEGRLHADRVKRRPFDLGTRR